MSLRPRIPLPWLSIGAALLVLAGLVALPDAASAATVAGAGRPTGSTLTLSVQPRNRSVHVGQTATYRVEVSSTTGPEDVGLSLGSDGLPHPVNFFFVPNPTQDTATLVVQTEPTTAPGRYVLTVFADTPTEHVTTTVKLKLIP